MRLLIAAMFAGSKDETCYRGIRVGPDAGGIANFLPRVPLRGALVAMRVAGPECITDFALEFLLTGAVVLMRTGSVSERRPSFLLVKSPSESAFMSSSL